MEKYLPGKVFDITALNKPTVGCTISEKIQNGITVFSLAENTDISAESYPVDTIIYVYQGKVKVKGTAYVLEAGQAFALKADTNFGFTAETDTVFIEAPVEEGKACVYGKPMMLNELVPYKEGAIVNIDVIHGNNMKYAVMAFDKGTGLDEHSAPGDALVTILDGKGIIGYEGKEYEAKAGQSFRFAAGGRHYVKAVQQKFRMSLMLVLK